MEIKIAGYTAASHLLEHEPGRWHAIVILGAGLHSSGYAEAAALSNVYLYFDDATDPQPGKITPGTDAIRNGIDFAKGKDRVLVTCRAGQGPRPSPTSSRARIGRRAKQLLSSIPPATAPIGWS